ncbi:hypothetical protein [Asanoa siamensis]|uniref:Apea-like HEPN domain-containing protein n=1 Tax=Asanoa siamensis TaxID=926357 RepID=A0ABQ4CV39_9ACTN|nr:hypothetical protein [Asanoa siamensis]GIF74722.1 hypothetical protein Asi02nite_42400 [Asanoa siamensis]
MTRIRATYSFYLDFMLPRLETGEAIRVHTKLDDCDAYICTWGLGEPLFPSEVDQTLSSYVFNLRPVARPEIAIHRAAKSRILDRISVTLEWEQVAAPVEDQAVTGAYLEKAIFGANAILEHIRVSCGLVEIRKIARTWDPLKSEISVTVPHTQAWFDAATGEGLMVFMQRNSLGSAEGIRIGPVPMTSLAELSKTLNGEGAPPLPLSLMMDAEEALTTLSIREATLLIATACEARANALGGSQSNVSKTRLKAIRSTPNTSFAGKYYDLLPQAVCAKSFQIDDPSAFSLIDQAYAERNQLIHTGNFSVTFQQIAETARMTRASEWLSAARRAIAWMDALQV